IPFEETSNLNIFPNSSSHGTILKIENLNSSWDKIKLTNLRRSLEKLINPFSKQNDFSIEIDATEIIDDTLFEDSNLKINGVIDNTILKILDLKTTQIDLQVKADLITTKIYDRGTLIYHIKEKNNYKALIDNLEINLYFLNHSAKINFTKLMD